MKNYLKAFLASLFLTAILFAGCSDDCVVTPKLHNENLFYNLDTFGIRTTAYGNINQMRSLTVNLGDNDEYRIEFDGTTNINDSLGLGSVEVLVTLYTPLTTSEYILDTYSQINKHTLFDLSTPLDSVGFQVKINSVSQEVIQNCGEAFVVLRDIRITKK